MSGRPTTAYRRIARNRIYTRLLLVAFFALLVPVFFFLSSYLAFWLVMYVGATPAMFEKAGIGSWRGAIALEIAAALLLACVTAARVIYLKRALPSAFGALRVPDMQGGVILDRLENLSLAAGLPAPKLWFLRGSECNAFAAGPDPERAVIVLTEGLLETLSRRELDGVIAHELSHIRNYDTRLNSLVAAIVRTVRLPPPIYWLLVLAGLPLLLSGGGLMREQWSMIREGLQSAAGEPDMPPAWLLIGYFAVMQVGLAEMFVWPGIARLIQSRISRRREYLADAEAVTITRDPVGLARALAKITSGGAQRGATKSASLRGIEHLCIAAPAVGAFDFLFPTHPAPEDRIAALEQMGLQEPFAGAAPADPEIQQAAELVFSRVSPQLQVCSVWDAVSLGFAAGAAVQAVNLGMRLYQFGIQPGVGTANDLRAWSFANVFGFAGTVAAFVAMRVSGRSYWWPLILMFVAGPYLALAVGAALWPEPLPWSIGAALLIAVISCIEPLAGAALGALARKSLLELLRDYLSARLS